MLIIALASALALTDPSSPPPMAVAEPAASASPSAPSLAKSAAELAAMKPGELARVGGDMAAAVTFRDGNYTIDRCLINTPLPEGYPAPTPPGAIDIKHYPVVRRAEYSSTSESDLGMNVGFFPLFNHIKRRDIEMTSPVEMDYGKLDAKPEDKNKWTMSFLYRRVDQAPTGNDPADKRVIVVDTQPMLVVSMGLRGSYGRDRVMAGVEDLRKWLVANPAWEEAGEARALYYNGPERPNRFKWLEVQLPIRLKAAPVVPPAVGG